MIEKRFIGSSGGVYDQYKSDRFAWSEWEEIIQIMNNLNEKARERSKALSKLQKENNLLKEKLNEILELTELTGMIHLRKAEIKSIINGDGDDDCFELYESKEDSQKVCDKINNILDENEQLKNELRIYRKLANCSNCQYHNYDTLFSGDDEYEVCDKGNDVTDGICKDWMEL